MDCEMIKDKIRHEIEFDKKQAKEVSEGVFRNPVLFARYDQAAIILEWVLKLLEGAEDENKEKV